MVSEGIIERVPLSELQKPSYYLPHRYVLKPSSMTPIRPVFDASAKTKESPSLNQCLHAGPNLIELIPTKLLRFRRRKIGVSADIAKAFLQISVTPTDRDVLRFLWWDSEGKIVVYRHCRAVFGVSSILFLLGATIEMHLLNSLQSETSQKSRDVIKEMLRSFYVDNYINSVDSYEDLKFIEQKAIKIMIKAGFNLRNWDYTGMTSIANQTSILVE